MDEGGDSTSFWRFPVKRATSSPASKRMSMGMKSASIETASGGVMMAATKALQDYVKGRLVPYKYPREIQFLHELPKTGTGKIDRQQVLKTLSDSV